jgi:hypothetical protein
MRLKELFELRKIYGEAAVDIGKIGIDAAKIMAGPKNVAKARTFKAKTKSRFKNFDTTSDKAFVEGGRKLGQALDYGVRLAQQAVKRGLNPQNIAEASVTHSLGAGAVRLGQKSLKRVGDGSPSLEAPFGYKLKKSADVGLGVVGGVAAYATIHGQVSRQQQIGKVEASGPMDQLSYDTGRSRSSDLSATGDLVFALKNLNHRGRV